MTIRENPDGSIDEWFGDGRYGTWVRVYDPTEPIEELTLEQARARVAVVMRKLERRRRGDDPPDMGVPAKV